MSSENGYMADLWRGLPMVVRVVFLAVFMWGAPTFASGFMIWVIATDLRTDVRDTRAQMLSHAQSTQTLYERMIEDRRAQDAKLDILIRIAQTNCVNQASDVVQRRDCLNAGSR